MKISFNTLNKRDPTEKRNILHAMRKVLESGFYILGPEVKKFELSFGKYIGTKHAIGVANGLEALQISLIALGIGPGDEVITTPLSAVATTLAIKAVGAEAVFVDIDEFCHIDSKKIEAKITSKTRAIIPVHLYGQPVAIETIAHIANKHKIHVIEDCAQAHGAMYKKKKVGSFGTLGCFSFYPTKNLGCIGDGGIITTNDDVLAEKCRMIRNYGQRNRYEHSTQGINSRLDELQAAILSEELKNLDQKNRRRIAIANLYRKELKNLTDLNLPQTRKEVIHVEHLFVIQTKKRDALQAFLAEKEITTLIHYPIPIHKQECFKSFNNLSLPIVEEYTQRILSLPIHPYLKNKEVLFICKQIRSFYGKK